jgi:hypothetical protein
MTPIGYMMVCEQAGPKQLVRYVIQANPLGPNYCLERRVRIHSSISERSHSRQRPPCFSSRVRPICSYLGPCRRPSHHQERRARPDHRSHTGPLVRAGVGPGVGIAMLCSITTVVDSSA